MIQEILQELTVQKTNFVEARKPNLSVLDKIMEV